MFPDFPGPKLNKYGTVNIGRRIVEGIITYGAATVPMWGPRTYDRSDVIQYFYTMHSVHTHAQQSMNRQRSRLNHTAINE
jgi:hypothetical protein